MQGPDWWDVRKPVRPRVSVKINSKGSVGVGVDEMLRFSIGVSLDGETLSLEEIASLLETSGGLVPLKGKWVEIDSEKLKAALEHWKDVEKDVRSEGVSCFEGMRLLSGVKLAKSDEDQSQVAIREWSGLTAGPELGAVSRACVIRRPGGRRPVPD